MFSEILIKIIQLSTQIESCICYSVSIGYAVILVCSTMPDWTCAERITGAPIGYGILAHSMYRQLNRFKSSSNVSPVNTLPWNIMFLAMILP